MAAVVEIDHPIGIDRAVETDPLSDGGALDAPAEGGAELPVELRIAGELPGPVQVGEALEWMAASSILRVA